MTGIHWGIGRPDTNPILQARRHARHKRNKLLQALANVSPFPKSSILSSTSSYLYGSLMSCCCLLPHAAMPLLLAFQISCMMLCSLECWCYCRVYLLLGNMTSGSPTAGSQSSMGESEGQLGVDSKYPLFLIEHLKRETTNGNAELF